MRPRPPASASQTELLRRLDDEWRVLAGSRLLRELRQSWATDDGAWRSMTATSLWRQVSVGMLRLGRNETRFSPLSLNVPLTMPLLGGLLFRWCFRV